jgi:hypothetical protein
VPQEIYCGTAVKTFCDRLAAPPLKVACVFELNGEQLAAFEKPFFPSQQPKLFRHPIRPRGKQRYHASRRSQCRLVTRPWLMLLCDNCRSLPKVSQLQRRRRSRQLHRRRMESLQGLLLPVRDPAMAGIGVGRHRTVLRKGRGCGWLANTFRCVQHFFTAIVIVGHDTKAAAR